MGQQAALLRQRTLVLGGQLLSQRRSLCSPRAALRWLGQQGAPLLPCTLA